MMLRDGKKNESTSFLYANLLKAHLYRTNKIDVIITAQNLNFCL